MRNDFYRKKNKYLIFGKWATLRFAKILQTWKKKNTDSSSAIVLRDVLHVQYIYENLWLILKALLHPKRIELFISTWKYWNTTVISMFCCPECNWSGLNLSERFMKKKWLASLLVIQLYIYLALIVNMKWEYYTSKSCGKGHDINCRTMYTMCTCGQGYSGIERFCHTINIAAVND